MLVNPIIKHINGRTLFVLLLLSHALFIDTALAAKIKVTFDRNPVNVDETFQILFSADEEPDGEPDFSPLEEDFEILSQSNSSNVSLINGKMSRSIRWTLNAVARRAGHLDVPPIRFGRDLSAAATLQVNENAGSSDLKSEEDIFIEVEATPEHPFIQQQILYTVRIYTRVEIARATINEPELTDAVIEKLGDDKSFSTQVNGVDYMVTERKYAIFPQKSGMITIEPRVLTAEVIANSRSSFNSFFNSNVTRTKRASSKAISMMVKPIPASFAGKHWLASEQLELSEEWSGDVQNLKIGEPVTRTLTLRAKGATVGQLPELNSATPNDAMKFYPDQPVLQEQKNGDGLLAQRQEKIALIPSKDGTYTLPAIQIPWFNIRTQQIEVAQIAEKTIKIAPSGSAASPETGKSQVAGTENKRPALIIQNQDKKEKNVWIGVSAALALGWLATLIFFLRRSPARASEITDQKTDRDAGEFRKQLKKACADNHAPAAKAALLAWGRQKFDARSLGDVAAFCDARLRDEILLLNRVLYSRQAEPWQGKKLYQAFTENKAREHWEPPKDDGLEPLYRL
ncbi:MAG: BatD family protein [Gammaproteobacteria bacterium]